MPTRKATARWEGDLKNGTGRMSVESGAFEDAAYSFRSRFPEGTGTNPEELIGAAHAGCFSMALANILAEAGHTPERVETTARVHLDPKNDGPPITKIELNTEVDAPGLDDAEFQRHARAAKEGCPVSQALAATEIVLNAKLVSETSA